ncbi:MAG: tetratricopeptide repeat protein [Deltaproteobacteria bacterium]|nr:tetratricopeptide repeat protein [Deltaproteobacteria bacterium]
MKRFLVPVSVLFFALLFSAGQAAAQDVKSLVDRGIANSQNGRYDQALKDFNDALKLKPNDALLITYRGVVYYAKRQTGLAMKDFDRAIRIDPKSGKAYYQRGMIYENQEQYSQAVPELKKAKSLGYNVDPVFIESLEKKAAQSPKK